MAVIAAASALSQQLSALQGSPLVADGVSDVEYCLRLWIYKSRLCHIFIFGRDLHTNCEEVSKGNLYGELLLWQ